MHIRVLQVGACIVNVENKIVGIGYNGMPNGCSDDVLPWTREGAWLETKYPYGTCVTPCCDTLHREARLHACLCCVCALHREARLHACLCCVCAASSK